MGANVHELFARGGTMAAEMAVKDWSQTPLGPVDAWPPSLQTALRILLTSRYAMWMAWGPELTFFCNDAYRPTLGVKQSWALGSSARQVWAEIWPDIGPRIDHVLSQGDATWDEGLLLFLERSGYPEETYHTFSYSPLFDDAGSIAGMLCVVTEETERIIGERRLAVLRDLASRLAASTTETDVYHAVEQSLTAASKDLPFSITYMADAAATAGRRRVLTGFDVSHPLAPEVIDVESMTGPWRLAPARDGSPLPQPVVVDRATMTGEYSWPAAPTSALVLPVTASAQARPFGVFVAGLNPFRRVDGAYRSFLALLVGQIAAGIASARAYEAERQRAEALAEIDRAKTTFFSNVSHEFRTPLTLMLGPLEDLLRENLPWSERDRLELVHRNGQRLLKLVNALLDFSRIEAGRMQAAYQPTDLAHYTVELASVFRSAMEKGGLRYTVNAGAITEPVHVDRDMWEKIVLNLISNAFKFTLSGEVRMELRERNGHVELEVADTGTGIPEAEIPRLFERFHRVEGTAGRSHEGTGIGLALVHELVRLHGGTVAVESEPGRGSTFTVRIPLGTAHIPPDRIVARDERARSTAASGFVEEALRSLPHQPGIVEPGTIRPIAEPGPMTGDGRIRARVIVADDNTDMRDYVSRLLAPDYEVEAVADGLAALAAAERRRPALILTDVMMPALDGFGLLQAIRRHADLSSVPVVLLSARAGEEATVEAMNAGADDYLIKPFNARELVARVRAQIDRAQFERTLAETQRQLREALAASRMLAWEWDPEQDAIEVSGRLGDVFGTAPGEPFAASMDGFRLVHPDDLPAHRALIEQAVRERSGYVSLFRVIRPVDGQVAWLEERASVTLNDDGAVRLSGIVMDVTERKRADERTAELLEAERAARTVAERTARIKDEFLATLSHELRTPLNAIVGWTHVLGRPGADDATLEEGLRVIARNAKVQAQMVDDLLDMSRIISGKVRLDVQLVRLHAVVTTALDTVRPTAEAKGVRLVAIMDPGSADVHGDPNRLQQIIWNLLVNAIKFTPKGGQIRVVLERVDSHLELAVHDTGEGIHPDFLPYVFERFRQADASTTRRYGGLGLGLSIVKQLVELHGGTITASSAGEGQGSTFTISLPLAALNALPTTADSRAHPASPQVTSDMAIGYDTSPALQGLRILVVDDDRDARDLLARLLGDSGVVVTLAASAEEGLALFRRERFALVICDIGMPEQDGYELIRQLRELPEESGGATPAVALTAFARSEDRRRALLAGYDIHVSKPVEPSEFLAVCEAMTARSARRFGRQIE